MVEVDLGCNPHPVRVTTYFFETVRLRATCENNNVISPAGFNYKCFISLILRPSAASTENILEPEPICISNVEFCVCRCGAGRQMDSIRRTFVYHRCKGGYIVDGFTRSNSTFRNRNSAARRIPDIFLMLIPERRVDCRTFHSIPASFR